MSVLALRAGVGLSRGFAGPKKAERIAAAIGCSISMAKYLLAGQRWTLDRLEQIGTLLDWGVENWLPQPSTPEEHAAEMRYAYGLRMQFRNAELTDVIEESRRLITEAARLLDSRPASESRQLMTEAVQMLDSRPAAQPNNRAGHGISKMESGLVEGLAQTCWVVFFTVGRAAPPSGNVVGAEQVLEPT